MNRNAAIDISRAIAVLLVTSLHVSRVSWLPKANFGPFDALGFMRNGWIGVGLFFVISGFCMSMTTKSFLSDGLTLKNYSIYVLKRFSRIVPAYYTSIFVWVLIIRGYNINPKPTGAYDILTHLTFTHNFMHETIYSVSGVFWSIAVEMQFYLVLPIIMAMISGLKSTMIVLSASLLMMLAVNVIDFSILIKLSLINYLFLFMYGYAIYKYKDSIKNLVGNNLTFVLLIFIFLCSLSLNGIDSMNKTYEALASVLFGLIMVGLDGKISSNENILTRTLTFIGKASFSIYLYNYIYGVVIARVDNHLSLVFMLLGTIAFGIMMYMIVEVNTEKLRKKMFKRSQ